MTRRPSPDIGEQMAAGSAERAGARRPSGGLGSRSDPATMRVVEVRRTSDRILHLGLRREDGGTLAFRPGQFCRVAIPTPSGEMAWRSYSIATPVTEDDTSDVCEIAAAAVPAGIGTSHLFSRRIGDRIQVCGPFGRLILPTSDPARYVLIGTGTGMAPYRSMLPELERRASATGLSVTLVMGVREPADALYADDFRAFVARDPERRRLLVSYSRQLPVVEGRLQARGYVQERLSELELSPDHDRVLLCGNPDMIDECVAELVHGGFGKADLIREKYLSGPAPR
ncbi:MAG: FAD-binding oxidoreductase [Halofilum sp. (in: g-proteobacteria)]|nr:FAD-binding oxidoreductase [Halofilum sp. (in: g-proteobacteria)]